MKIDQLKQYKKILILGYGREGAATEKFLKKFVPECEIGIADIKDGSGYLDKQKSYDLVIKTPGIPKKLVQIPYTTASNIFLANVNNTVIGLTGTKGKSTTASLIHSIIVAAGKKSFLVGNIGQPALEILLNPINDDDIFVCEFSSYQLDDINYSPRISVILDLYPEHMDYHGTVEAYYQAKKNILKFVKKSDYFVFNPKFSQLELWSKQTICQTIPYETKILLSEKEIPLIGEHNLDNIRAAVTVSHILKISDDVISKAIKNFKPLRHRLQLVGSFNEIIFYDDAISTTPESTIFAVKTLKNIGTIFLGGLDRGYNFSDLVKNIIEYKIPNIVFFPETGIRILKLLPENEKNKRRILLTRNMEEAVKFAYQHTPKGTVCLLSTASPSYSIWKNFEEKGDLFQFFVKTLGNEKKN